MKALRDACRKRVNWLAFIVLAVYIAFISYRLFFYAYTDNPRHTMEEISFNLVPFKTIGSYLANRQSIGFKVWIYNLAGNIAAFTPLGFFLPAAHKGLQSLKGTLTAAFTFVLFAEAAQLATRRGVFDVDDIILNSIGVIIGYYIYKFVKEIR